MPDQASTALVYASGVVLKSGAAGILLGWIFLRYVSSSGVVTS
jgi:hypothetical protein